PFRNGLGLIEIGVQRLPELHAGRAAELHRGELPAGAIRRAAEQARIRTTTLRRCGRRSECDDRECAAQHSRADAHGTTTVSPGLSSMFCCSFLPLATSL